MTITKDATLAEVIETGIESALLNLNTCTAGVVESYNPANQTVSVRLANKRVYQDFETGDLILDTEPILEDVPVCTIGASGITFTIPLQKGDSVLLLFTHDDISNFRSSGKPDAEPNMLNRHSLSNALALPIQIPKRSTTAFSSVMTIGSGPLVDFVALASLVNDNFTKIADLLNTTGLAVTGSTAKASTPISLGDVSCTKLKVE